MINNKIINKFLSIWILISPNNSLIWILCLTFKFLRKNTDLVTWNYYKNVPRKPFLKSLPLVYTLNGVLTNNL